MLIDQSLETSEMILLFIICPCLIRAGNYQIREFDWLKRIIDRGLDFPI